MITPFQFDEHHDAALLIAAGYHAVPYEESWEDIGGPESGPKIVGVPAFTVWQNDEFGHEIIVMNGQVCDAMNMMPEPEGC